MVGTFGLLAWFWPIARRQSGEQFQAVQQLVADARRAVVLAVEAARERGRREAQALVSERDQQLAAVEQKLHSVVGERERWKEAEMSRAGQTFPSALAELRDELDAKPCTRRSRSTPSRWRESPKSATGGSGESRRI